MPTRAHAARTIPFLAGCLACGVGAHVARAQTVVDGVAFIDRAAAGEITLGSIRGAAAALDADNDGWMDLAVADDAGRPLRLFLNRPDPARPGRRTFTDATVGSGLDDAEGVARFGGGVIAADDDNDGDTDLFFNGNLAGSFGLLYRNNGDGTFTNASAAAGVRRSGSVAESASWNDYDLDGFVDLFLFFNAGGAQKQMLLRNNRDGTYTDRTDLLPVLDNGFHIYAHTWTDFDADGWADCFILHPRIGAAGLFRNVPDGAGGRRFIDDAVAAGFTVLGPAPMGIAAGDYDNDGDPDIAITDASVGTYYRNNGDGTLSLVPLLSSIWGWGVAWLDADNDGLLDNYQAGSLGWPQNGGANADRLFRNLGAGQFANVSAALNTTPLVSQYAVQLDFNNDGRTDLVTTNWRGFAQPGSFLSVYENASPGQAAGANWTTISLLGDGPPHRVNRNAVGAVVRVVAGGVARRRELAAGSSTASSDDPRAHVGLGAATTIDRIEVRWPRSGPIAARTRVYEGPFPVNAPIVLRAPCAADLTGDSSVTFADLNAVLSSFGQTGAPGFPAGDADGDGNVTFADLNIVLSAFGMDC